MCISVCRQCQLCSQLAPPFAPVLLYCDYYRPCSLVLVSSHVCSNFSNQCIADGFPFLCFQVGDLCIPSFSVCEASAGTNARMLLFRIALDGGSYTCRRTMQADFHLLGNLTTLARSWSAHFSVNATALFAIWCRALFGASQRARAKDLVTPNSYWHKAQLCVERRTPFKPKWRTRSNKRKGVSAFAELQCGFSIVRSVNRHFSELTPLNMSCLLCAFVCLALRCRLRYIP